MKDIENGMIMNQKSCGIFKVFLFILVLVNWNWSFAQTVINEIELPKGSLFYVKGTVVGDSILAIFSTGKADYSGTLIVSKENNANAAWINNAGSVRYIDINELHGKVICAVVPKQTATFFYFLDAKAKSNTLQALIFDERSKTKTISKSITLPGKLIGSYIEKNLRLVTFGAKESSIDVLELDQMEVVNRQTFKFPATEVGKNEKNITFIGEDEIVSFAQSLAKVKVIKEDEYLYLVNDEPAPEYGEVVPPFRTTVFRLNLLTGETSNKFFFQSSIGSFTTIIKNGCLYRVTRMRNSTAVEIIDFEKAQVILSRALDYPDTNDTLFGYTRYGRRKEVRRENNIKAVVRSVNKPFIIVDTNRILTFGTRLETESMPIIVPAAGGLLLTFASALIREVDDGPSNYSYFYLDEYLNMKPDHVIPLRQKIDNYELNESFSFKGYLNNSKVTYGLYRYKNSNSLRIVKFE